MENTSRPVAQSTPLAQDLPESMTLDQVHELQEWIVDGELVVQDEEFGRIHVLNSSAAHVWWLCDGNRDEDGIVDELAALYGYPGEQIRDDVLSILEAFRDEGLLES